MTKAETKSRKSEAETDSGRINMYVDNGIHKQKQVVVASYPIGETHGVPYQPVSDISSERRIKVVAIELPDEEVTGKLEQAVSGVAEEGLKVTPCEVADLNGRKVLPLILSGYPFVYDAELATYSINSVKGAVEEALGRTITLNRRDLPRRSATRPSIRLSRDVMDDPILIYQTGDFKATLEKTSPYFKSEEWERRDDEQSVFPPSFIATIPEIMKKLQGANEKHALQRIVDPMDVNIVGNNGKIAHVEYSVPLGLVKTKVEKGIIPEEVWSNFCDRFAKEGYVFLTNTRSDRTEEMMPIRDRETLGKYKKGFGFGCAVQTVQEGLEAIAREVKRRAQWNVDVFYSGKEIKSDDPTPKLVSRFFA